MERKFKVGDKVKWKEDSKSYAKFTEGRYPEEILTVSGFDRNIIKFEEFKEGAFDSRFELVEQASEERGMSVNKPDWKDAPSWATVLLKHATNPNLYAFAEKYHEGERFTRSDYNFEVVYDFLLPINWDVVETRQETLETSNEKPPYLSFFTSVIVAKNKDVSDIGEMLYDENTTKISLEDEGGGAFLIVEQDYNGTIQQIRLDIDEVDAVFSAIKQLVKQLDIRS